MHVPDPLAKKSRPMILSTIWCFGGLTWKLDGSFLRRRPTAALLPPNAQPNPREPNPLLLLALDHSATAARRLTTAVPLLEAHASRRFFSRRRWRLVLFVVGLLGGGVAAPPPLQEATAHGLGGGGGGGGGVRCFWRSSSVVQRRYRRHRHFTVAERKTEIVRGFSRFF